jgi:hypothetical protein
MTEAIERFEHQRQWFDPHALRQHAAGFKRDLFRQRIADHVTKALAAKGSVPPAEC